MAKAPGKFKPFVGRCFELKNFVDLKKFPPVVLIMDETKKEVMFLDNEGLATWISKFYLRDKPVESRVYASPDTLTEAIGLIEDMRTGMVEGPLAGEKKRANELNKRCATILQQLRDLGNRMQGVRFAPPIDETPVEVAPEPSTFERDKALAAEQS
jgi:hypothetical protein